MSKARQTRKKRLPPMTLVELKSMFDRVRKGAAEILRDTTDKKQRIKKFQVLWKGLFQHPVEPMAADIYLTTIHKGVGAKRGATRKKQKGGMAPLDFQTRPGVDGVHGSFPQYLTAGLGFQNTVGREGMFQDCGRVDITPVVPESISSNKFGGGTAPAVTTMLGDMAFLAGTRPIPASSPPSLPQTIQNMFLGGKTAEASPRVDQNPLIYN